MIKNILIITPHYPPSNLAAVHRSRLFAQHLPANGWQPIILTVHEKYYEEKLDCHLFDLLPKNHRIVKANAFRIRKPRLIGDIGLRAFFQLRKSALKLLQEENIDFVYIPIPSFYTALIGPYLFKKTGVKYGIDYIDPWVHNFPGSEKIFSRHWLSTLLAKIFEPIAVKHASFISGVSAAYFSPVFDRNPHLKKSALSLAIPYGGEEKDHLFARKLLSNQHFEIGLLPPKSSNKKFRFVYAGAILPKAYEPLGKIFQAVQTYYGDSDNSSCIQPKFYFIGTGGVVKPLAEKYNLFNSIIFEHADRMPYLNVLLELEKADGVFIIGSTERHYTPSKVFQAVLANKPILAVLHQESTAVKFLEESNAGVIVYNNEKDTLGSSFLSGLKEFHNFQKTFDPINVNKEALNKYSAKSVTKLLVDKLNIIASSAE